MTCDVGYASDQELLTTTLGKQISFSWVIPALTSRYTMLYSCVPGLNPLVQGPGPAGLGFGLNVLKEANLMPIAMFDFGCS